MLSDLPNSILDRILVYASRYRPGPDGLNIRVSAPARRRPSRGGENLDEDYQTMKGGKTTSEADWKRYKMEERIEEILRSFSDLSNRYSLTIYQIAIEFAEIRN